MIILVAISLDHLYVVQPVAHRPMYPTTHPQVFPNIPPIAPPLAPPLLAHPLLQIPQNATQVFPSLMKKIILTMTLILFMILSVTSLLVRLVAHHLVHPATHHLVYALFQVYLKILFHVQDFRQVSELILSLPKFF